MRDGNSKKSKLTWPKTLVKKWFNIKSKSEEFQADEDVHDRGLCVRNEALVNQSSVTGNCTKTSSRRNSDGICWSQTGFESSQATDLHNYRIFAATWNVAGKSPPGNLNLEDWFHSSPPADIYVLGFQEIVPLNAGNILGTEDNAPAKKWQALLRKTLNSIPENGVGWRSPSPFPHPIADLEADFEGSTRHKASSLFPRLSFQSQCRRAIEDDYMTESRPCIDRRYSVCDGVILGGRTSDSCSSDEFVLEASPESSPMAQDEGSFKRTENSKYCLVAGKQMVGILLTVWAKKELKEHIRNLKVSCVGRGLMGYLGNKGSISISLSLHQTSFCFVCSHLTSGQKEGDELRRNSDVLEILKKTMFPRVHAGEDLNTPQSILEHDRVIWLGDLNYRIGLCYRAVKALVDMRNWNSLLQNDQLRIEQRHGRVFEGWNEGKIYFPPTYKYSNNSDRYAGDDGRAKEKRRTPAWCDRILWYGKGLKQLSYLRGESRFSDHRPVYSIFLAEVESVQRKRIKKSNSSYRIEVEELLPHSHRFSDFNFY